MREETTEHINTMLAGIIDSATQTKDFILAEIPDVVFQLLRLKFVESLIFCILGIVLAVALVRLDWCFYKKLKENYSDDVELVFLTLFCNIPWVAVFCLINLDWLKIWIAPKVYLLEYGASLIK